MSVRGKFSRFRSFVVAGTALLATAGVAGESTVSAWAQTSYYPQQTAPNYSYQQPTTQTPGYSYQQPYGSSSYPNYPTQAPAYQGGYSYNPYWSGSSGRRIIPAWGHRVIQLPGDGRGGTPAGGAGPDGVPLGGPAGGAVGLGLGRLGLGSRLLELRISWRIRARRICRLPRRRLGWRRSWRRGVAAVMAVVATVRPEHGPIRE